jgi:hypothetical protein
LVSVKERRLKRPLPVARYLHIERADAGGEVSRVRSVPEALSARRLLVRCGVQVLGHDRVQDLA